MSGAFTEKERKYIMNSLKIAANNFAATIGMRKTTVDQLVEKAGISKGAFYTFYASKELLFFEVVEDWHTEIYSMAETMIEKTVGLPDEKRLEQAILVTIDTMETSGMIGFMENDMPHILRKLPDEVLQNHYHSDTQHLVELLEKSGLKLSASYEVAAKSILSMAQFLSRRQYLGHDFEEVFHLLVRGLCHALTTELCQ